MRQLTRLRLAAVAVAALTTFAPGVAHADTPANDDVDGATEITALPATTTVDTTGATKASDDPSICNYQSYHSVWLRFTATADGLVKLSNTSERYATFYGVFTGTRGALTPVPGACTTPGEREKTFSVKAGTTYHLAVVEHYSGYPGPVTLAMMSVRAAPNDDRAAAAPITLPSRIEGDLTRATPEPGEVPPSCDATATQSLWYSYTATRSRWVSLSAYYNSISVHRATDPSEVDCFPSGGNSNGSVFAATEGETYLVRVARSAREAATFWMDVEEAAPIRPTASNSRYQPSALDNLSFQISSGDPHGRDVTSGVIDFGDGTTKNYVAYEEVRHQYARDGVYTVTMTGSTRDGRTGTGTSTVTIDTHDVSVAALSVPSSVRAGQTKPIKVSVANTRQTENVRVTLYRVSETGGYDEQIGQTVQRVAASPTGRVDFPFAYTYTAKDATLGKVTFRAVAALENWNLREAKPDDNEARATTATVRPAASASALVN
ncbi:PKD domain-containing protein [Lentzea sp. E54]|uniref:PKD domain-containing protein n=1 Tax=Lentzea xerophila TaxID=3435883 RepID=UPI003DA3AB66